MPQPEGVVQALGSPAVDLWLAFYREIAEPRLLARMAALLSGDERRQQGRFLFADDRLRYLVTRALVRTVLSRYAAVRPADWVFAADRYGRPRIAGPAGEARSLHFNVSHTAGLIVLAVSRQAELGVDVENVCARREATGIADRFFAPAEAAALAQLPLPQRHERFMEFWTFKEAYVKARGMGLSIPLDKFSFHLPCGGGLRFHVDPELGDDAGRWRFWQFRPTPAHLLALCAQRVPGPAAQPVLRKVVPLGGEERLVLPVQRSGTTGP